MKDAEALNARTGYVPPVRTVLFFALLAARPGAVEPEERAPRQWLLGAQAGVAQPDLAFASPGPSAGVVGELSLSRQLAIQLGFEQSVHRVDRGAALLNVSSAAGGLGYRFDVAGAVPYLGLGLRGSVHLLRGQEPEPELTGTIALGLLYPLWERWFAGAEARYGYGLLSGQFPVGRSLQLRFGYRSAAF